MHAWSSNQAEHKNDSRNENRENERSYLEDHPVGRGRKFLLRVVFTSDAAARCSEFISPFLSSHLTCYLLLPGQFRSFRADFCHPLEYSNFPMKQARPESSTLIIDHIWILVLYRKEEICYVNTLCTFFFTDDIFIHNCQHLHLDFIPGVVHWLDTGWWKDAHDWTVLSL